MPVILSKCGDQAVAQAAAAPGSETDILRESKQEVGFCHTDGSGASSAESWIAGEGAIVDELPCKPGVADVKNISAVVVVLEAKVDIMFSVHDAHGVLHLGDGVVEQGDEVVAA